MAARPELLAAAAVMVALVVAVAVARPRWPMIEAAAASLWRFRAAEERKVLATSSPSCRRGLPGRHGRLPHGHGGSSAAKARPRVEGMAAAAAAARPVLKGCGRELGRDA